MCGIAGLLTKGTAEESRAHIERMLLAMRHRGPDGYGTHVFHGGALGMCRLALVDLSARGQQPIWSQDERVAILFNGEMYNFRPERSRLEANGYRFRSSTDTEVALALYLERGPEFVNALRGMFALAILDWRHSSPAEPPEIVLARDRFGVKPLWITEGAWGIAFASELRALLAGGFLSGQLDPRGLMSFLSQGFVLQPGSILRGARMLPAGSFEVITSKGVRRAGRLHPLRSPNAPPRSFAEAAKTLRAVVQESVALHALADAPVGAFLSGGVDSSAIVALMRPHVSQLHTYSLSSPGAGGTDESRDAAATASRLGCIHTSVVVDGRDVAGVLPTFARDLDQPSCDGLNTWLVSRLAARDVKGVLSGLGGDEWFGGYPVASKLARYSSPFHARFL
ncbi:MAG: asparagine synthase (glutamine-hydrolyzing), partial [Acidobacteria bacterium]|nr:asparagine synthase (glutamine-hydrolyzing) [Acidobacteriota bacterium]